MHKCAHIERVRHGFVSQESQVMLSTNKEDLTTVQIPMEKTKPAQAPKAHDPR